MYKITKEVEEIFDTPCLFDPMKVYVLCIEFFNGNRIDDVYCTWSINEDFIPLKTIFDGDNNPIVEAHAPIENKVIILSIREMQ